MPRTGNNISPGTLAADAMLSQTEYTGVQIALISNMEIRNDLIPGPVTLNTIHISNQYGNAHHLCYRF